jgi:SEC-C motif-containing protein
VGIADDNGWVPDSEPAAADHPPASSTPPVRCPCQSGNEYPACCGRLHSGDARAATAEQLMRSRYSAFAVGDAAYLLRSWHPRTRPATIELDESVRWLRLDIDRTVRGGMLDTEGIVEFTAHSRRDGRRTSQHEISRFEKVSGDWVYLDAVD